MHPREDAFGRALLDWTRGGTDPEILERDDGFFDTGAGPDVYLAPFGEWPRVERQAMRYVRGRVIDVGCGAGRVALHLQDRGFQVVGVDHSPRSVRASRLRGVNHVEQLAVDRLASRIGAHDTLILFGNNFGMFGSPDRTRRILAAWARRAGTGTRVLAESMNPYHRPPPWHRAYQRRNRRRGRMAGQARIRVRYRDSVSPWFDWLLVSPAEMGRILRGTGWEVLRLIGPDDDQGLYVAVLEKP